MIQKPIVRATFDQNGFPTAFYPEDIWPEERVPSEAIEISHDDYREFLDYQGQRKWDGKKVVEGIRPPESVPPESDEIAVRLGQETAEMHSAVTATVVGFAGLENSLAHLLACILGHYGMAVYFVPSAAETRIAIVDEVMHQFLMTHAKGNSILPLWSLLKDKIDNSKSKRNKIIHGNIVTEARSVDSQSIRLTSPIFDMRYKNLAKMSRDSKGSDAQLSGMSVNDVKACSRAIATLAHSVSEFSKVLSEMQKDKQEDEVLAKKIETFKSSLAK